MRWEDWTEHDELTLAHDLCTLRWRPAPRLTIELPKRSGGTRKVWVSTLRDKVVEGAWKLALTELFPFPERCDLMMGPLARGGAQLPQWLGTPGARWVLRSDIRACFDEIAKAPLLSVVGRRLHDGRSLVLLHRLLGPEERGVPQGLVCAPILANLYLANALDVWRGRVACFARYADDLCSGHASRYEAATFLGALAGRLEAFGLALSEEKTVLADSYHDPVSFLGLTREPGGRVVPDRSGVWPEREDAREGARSHYARRCSRSALRGLR